MEVQWLIGSPVGSPRPKYGETGAVEADSSIVMTIAADGSITGELSATEELENYLASIDLACGLLTDGEECDDSVVECPATVQWGSDLGSLEFVGAPPDEGTVAGTVTIIFETTPQGCDDPSTGSQTIQIGATVSPDGAQITTPFVIDLDRVESSS